MTLDSKTLLPAQEAEITARLATASRLSFPAFCKAALKHPHFPGWFERRFHDIPTLEKITPDIRAAFMVDWKRTLRDIAARENEQAELDAAEDDEADADADAEPQPDFDADIYASPQPSAPPTAPDQEFGPEDAAAEAEAVKRLHERWGDVTPEFEGTTLADDDGDDDLPDYLVDKMIPLGPSLTILWGLPDAGKSMIAQKTAVVVGAPSGDLDGRATLHGPVLYVSLDLGARQKRVKRRMRQIADKLGLPYSAQVVLVHDVVNLLDPRSVSALLERWPGPWAMIVLDPLNKMIGNGDPSQPGVILPAFAGAHRMATETGAAVVVVTHSDKKDSDIYGNVFQAGNADAILHMQRHHQKDGQARDGDRVTMTWGRLRNDSPPDKPAEYVIDEAYLAPVGESAGKRAADPGTIKRRDVLDLLATEWTMLKGLRAAINAKLPDYAKPLDEKQWFRLREDWQAAGLIEQDGNRIRRVS